MNPNFRNFALWVIIFLLVVALVMLFQNPGQRTQTADISFSQLLTEATDAKDVVADDIEIDDEIVAADDDDTFLEEEEEGADDVSGLIDGEIEGEDEVGV